jgi:CheY-like chemotaxis protein
MENLPDLFLNNNRLEQVFINLIINAAQAFEQKNIEINFIQISTNVENNNIRIDISDNAKGIPKNILPQIFEPFFTTKPVGIGTGLGLSICHDIVYSLGGHINVDSTVGKGTTFSIYVPMKISMVNVNSNDSAFSEMLTNKKILLVDDDPTSLVIFKRIIGDTQNIVTAQSGRSAIELLKTSTDEYDLIISDLYMPDVDGSDLYRYVSRNHPGLEKRIIFMSGGEYTDAINDFITHIQNDCLKKPFTSDELLNAITNMVKE